jgi:hypothetical protein
MYDESIQRSARRAKIRPIVFEHPLQEHLLACFQPDAEATSVILTGTAGDGKTHLCRQVWQQISDSSSEKGLDDSYVSAPFVYIDGRELTVHVIKDLSEWAPQPGAMWEPEKEELLQRFCRSLFELQTKDVFLIAANDGQLIESWRLLKDTDYVIRARKLFEKLLVEDLNEVEGARLKFFNLSRGDSAELLDRVLDALISHEGWQKCYQGTHGENDAFGPHCPIRHNFELLQTPLVQKRLRALFELCDFNELHIPIRQILLLLSNAILGHPDAKDRLMAPKEIPKIIRDGKVAKASLYNNIFGGNLSETRREAITVFDYLDRFRIGHETSNRIDNILIFGEADDEIRPYFDQLLRADRFYGADESYYVAQRDYVEGADEDEPRNRDFLNLLISQRRGLFFKIPVEQEEELHLWELTVFKYAGEYLNRVVRVLNEGHTVEHPILARLVKGLNRIFVGMLVSNDREVFLATSLSFSNAKVSRMLEDSIPVRPRGHERVEIVLKDGVPNLNVVLTDSIHCSMQLHLIRYEFLSRVAEGALPGSFSKECYEDILAFKSQLLARLSERQRLYQRGPESTTLTFRLLNLDDLGNPTEELVEVMR